MAVPHITQSITISLLDIPYPIETSHIDTINNCVGDHLHWTQLTQQTVRNDINYTNSGLVATYNCTS